MTLQIVIDMNLSPAWVPVLAGAGWHAVHWSAVGDPRSPDQAIMQWALSKGYVVFTHDLGFGTLLALTQAAGPSVIQVRAQNVLPDYLGAIVVAAIRQFESMLASGALVVVDEGRSVARLLPLRRA